MQPTHRNFTVGEVLAVSLELCKANWKIALQDGRRGRPPVHTVRAQQPAARLGEAVEVIERTRAKWGLPGTARVVVVYEAGQEGFWIQRALSAHGYEALITNADSIPVARQARRAKTDRLDAVALVAGLWAWLGGERSRMHVIRVPSEPAEAQRHWMRERGQLQKETQQHRDRIRKLLCTYGCWEEIGADFDQRLARGELTDYAGRALPEEVRERLGRECERLALAKRQLAALEAQLPERLPAPVRQEVLALAQLKGIGQVGALRLVLELLWRDFGNRREVGSCVGVVPQPYDSGQSHVDQGISKQGNRRVRALLIEMAWMWVRYQPDSALARWFAQRVRAGGANNKRVKRIAIVAVARRLAIALWRYLREGLIPQGAQLKSGTAHAQPAGA